MRVSEIIFGKGSKPPRETHRNFQIWLAIDEVVNEWAQAQNQSTQSACRGSSPGELPFPTTSDVRRWIAAHSADSRFDTLRTLDDKGWNRLKEDAGINVTEHAYDMLAGLSGLALSTAELAGCDEFLPTSVLERGGRGEARIEVAPKIRPRLLGNCFCGEGRRKSRWPYGMAGAGKKGAKRPGNFDRWHCLRQLL